MLLIRDEMVIMKKVKVLEKSALGFRYFKKETLQKCLRTTWKILFIPVFTYDKRID